MFDVKAIRDDPAAFDAGCAKRGLPAVAVEVVELDDRRRELQTRLQELQQRRNEASRAIGEAKGRGEDAAGLIAEVGELKERVRRIEDDDRAAAAALEALLAGLPNVPDAAA